MPANTAPIFELTARASSARITTAISDATSTGPLRANGSSATNPAVTLFSAGTNGTRIDRITMTGEQTTNTCQVLFWVNDGSADWFVKEFSFTGNAAATTTAATQVEWIRTDGLPLFSLPTGYSIKCAITVAPTSGAIVVTAYGGDY